MSGVDSESSSNVSDISSDEMNDTGETKELCFLEQMRNIKRIKRRARRDKKRLSEGQNETAVMNKENDPGNRKEELTSSEARKWHAGTWPVTPFDDKVAINERKVEWINFRDQFNLVLESKGEANEKMKINALKIHAGKFLRSVIKMIEETNKDEANDYPKLVELIDKHFESTYDKQMERIKCEKLRQKDGELFSDWIIRLQEQISLCGYDTERKKEALKMGLILHSLPEIANELFKLSHQFGDSINKYVNHGNLLENMKTTSLARGNDEEKKDPEQADKPVNAVKVERLDKGNSTGWKQNQFNRTNRFKGYQPYQPRGFKPNQSQAYAPYQPRYQPRQPWRPRGRFEPNQQTTSGRRCVNCGDYHGVAEECRAMGKQCFSCGGYNHFSICSRAESKANTGRLAQWNENAKNPISAVASKINKVSEVKDEGLLFQEDTD